MSSHPRAGIIGTGFMGAVHSRAIRRSGAVVSRVVGSTPESTRATAPSFDPEFSTETVWELIRADDVDVVHICTTNATQAGLARAALEAGKHVVCEKPLAVDAQEATELADLARSMGVVATVPFVYRFYPSVRRARARIADGTSGRPYLMHGSYLQDWLAVPADSDWRVDPEHGGPSRAFADIGVHWCDLIEFVTGHRITRLSARTMIAIPERGGRRVTTEDAALLMFETDRGSAGTLTVSQVSVGRKNRLWFSIDAAAESMSFDQENPETLWVGGLDENRVLTRGGADAYSVLPAGHPQGYQDCFDAFVADTYRAIEGTVPDGLPTFADGVRAAHLTEAVLTSARTEQWIDVSMRHNTIEKVATLR